MGQHHVVQAEAAGREAFGLGVIDAVDQPHELRHDVAMIPGRAEGVLRHRPAFGKMTKSILAVPSLSLGEVMTVKIDGSGWSKGDRADRRIAAQVIFVGRVIAVPGRRRRAATGRSRCGRVRHTISRQAARDLLVLIACDGGEEVAGIGEAVGADRPRLGKVKTPP